MFNISTERELLITQGLNDLDIQEDQNAVFICELSVEDIPGEWYKNGERIQPTSTIKIRQEGQLWGGALDVTERDRHGPFRHMLKMNTGDLF